MKTNFVLITGAASGIGKSLCINYAKRNYVVYAVDKNEIELAKLKEEIYLLKVNEFYFSHFDLSKKETVYNLAEDVLSKINNRKLLLINNAGANLISGFLHDTPIEGFEWLMNTNFWSMVYLTQSLLPYMLKQNDGHIVNLSSVFGLFGVKTCVPYCASKFAVRGYTESLKMELVNTNVRITCVHPGGIKTNINLNSKLMGDKSSEHRKLELHELFLKQARTSADQAAQAIVNAVENNKSRLLIGVDAKVLDIIVRIFPANYHKVLDLIAKIVYPNSLNQVEKVYQ